MADIIVTSSGYATGAIDTATTLVAAVSPALVNHINGPTSAIIQIETILGSGTDLKGSAADLAVRIARVLQASGVLKATPDLDTTLTLSFTDSRTNTTAAPVIISDTTSGTPAAGIGTGLKFTARSADENPSSWGQIEFAASDVTAASEDTYFQVLLRVAGAALAAAYRLAATTAFRAIFTHANSADRTYTLPNFDGTFATVDGAETLTNKTLTSPTVTGNTIGTGAVKTSTGSASGTNVDTLDVTMNDYSFSPSLGNISGSGMQMGTAASNPGDTVGRFVLSANPPLANSNPIIRWRYITASDDPTIWVAVDGAGDTKGVWVSDDPTPDGSPGIAIAGCTSTMLKSTDLDAALTTDVEKNAALDYITSRKLRATHVNYRALQIATNDPAPSRWLLENIKIDKGKAVKKEKPVPK